MKNRNILKKSVIICSYLLLIVCQLSAEPPLQDSIFSKVVINEFLADNKSVNTDENGEFEDWIELYNGNEAAVDLGGCYLSDDLSNPTKWRFPDSTMILPNNFLVIWADNDSNDGSLHAAFKLSKSGEEIGLFAPDGTTRIDSVVFSQMLTDTSYGRQPDGSDTWFYLSETSPGSSNGTSGYREIAGAPELNQAAGFYYDSLKIIISTDISGAKILFTLNGSSPEKFGVLFEKPITLYKTTPVRAQIYAPGLLPSRIVTRTYIFPEEVKKQSPTGEAPGPGWPSRNVNGQWIDYGMDPDVVYDPDYADSIAAALLSIPSISLVTDLDNLFHPSKGIYVNALHDGRDWERPVSVEFIFPDGKEGFQIDAGLRIRGGASRLPQNVKHSFRLFFRSEYGASKLRYPLFDAEGVDEFDKIDIRCKQSLSWSWYNEPNCTMARSAFARDLQGKTGEPYTRSRNYHLYINGQYWGIYQTQERAEADFAQSYFGGAKEDYDVIKPRGEIAIIDGNFDAYRRLWLAAVHRFNSDKDYYRTQGLNTDGTPNPNYERLLDVDNVINYLLTIYYTGNWDGPVTGEGAWTNNFIAIYNRENPDGFKFIAHDTEAIMVGLDMDRTGPWDRGKIFEHFNPQWLLQKLMAHPDFKMRFADLTHKYFFNHDMLTPDKVAASYITRADNLKLAIIAESARWGDAKEAWDIRGTQTTVPRTKNNDWLPAVNNLLHDYFPYRSDIVLQQFKEKGWYPDVDAPVFNEHGGYFKNNVTVRITSQGQPGKIFYTTDGSDPRKIGGGIYPNVLLYKCPFQLPRSCNVKTRLLYKNVWSAINEAKFVIIPDSSFVNNILFTEINYNSADNFDPEDWIEIYNPTASTVSLSGWIFEDENDQHNYHFPETATINPDGYLVLCKNIEKFKFLFPEVKNCIGGFDFGLSGYGEMIRLFDSSETLIDSLVYGNSDPWPKQADGFGPTLELKNPGLDNASGANWNASEKHGTPGAKNSAFISVSEPQPVILPANYILTKNYPNPFNSQTTISFEIPEFSFVTLSIYNLLGQIVQTVVTEELPAGKYDVVWDAGKLCGGVYFYQLKANNYSNTLKCLLVR